MAQAETEAGMGQEQTILAKAAALGAALPTFRMCDRPELFASWADRVAWADSLRHAGKPYLDALDECDRQVGLRPSRVVRDDTLPVIPTDGLWLEKLAALLNAPFEAAAVAL